MVTGLKPYDFTDIDRSLSAGVSISGKAWGRERDTVGIAAVVNGILVGDGRLPNAGDEAIGELYYSWCPSKPVKVTLDYQLVGEPRLQSGSRAGQRDRPAGAWSVLGGICAVAGRRCGGRR